MNRKVVVIVSSAALAAAGLAAATSGGAAAAPSGSAPEALDRADALTRAPAAAATLAYAAPQARAAANARGAGIPLPAGGTFSGVRWELAGGNVGAGTLDGVLQYNAACQWLRAWRDGRDGALAVQVLQSVPSWSAFRGTESGALLTAVASDVSKGGGETAAQMLVECDASHIREAAYAREIGLPASS
jgi:hypothetical protein